MTTISTLASITTAPSYATAGLPTGANASANAANGTAAPDGAPGTTTAAPSPLTSVTLSTLSAEAGIVATLNGAAGASAYSTYDATGLLNMVAQAGMAAAGAAGNAATTATAPATVSADWGSLLKSNPGLTPVAVGYAVTQDIVNTFSTEA